MSRLTNYIIRGAVGTVVGLAIGETLITTIEAVKMRNYIIKRVSQPDENGDVNMESVKEAKSAKHFLKCMREAAKHRVEEIKKDPGAEICAIWGCITYFAGNWQGFNTGFLKGFDHGANGINALMNYFKDKFPDEMTSIIKKAKANNVDVLLTEYAHNNTIERIRWVAEACDLPVIKEVEA